MTFHRSNRCLLLAAAIMFCVGTAVADQQDSSTQDRDQRIAELISQLGDSEFAVRDRAQRELVQLGFAAFDALSEAEESDDIEVASQARYLVRLIRVDWVKDSDPPQIRAMLRDYDSLNVQQRLERIKQLAGLSGDNGIEWLIRLVRFEQSQVLSKRAALAIISQGPQPDDEHWPARADLVLKAIDRSKRPAADWLRTYVLERSDAAKAVEQWGEHVKSERRSLQQRPAQSHHTLVLDLMRRQVELYDQLQRPDDALEIMRKMVAAERGDSESLGSLVAWFAKRQGWTAIDELAARFARTFDSDPLLLYALAEARLSQGKPDEAEDAVARALKVNGDKGLEHLQVADQLQERGMIRWSEREYQHVIATGAQTPAGLLARWAMSEIYHDRLEDQPAAEMIDQMLKIMEKDKNLSTRIQQRIELPTLNARMNYYLAKHFEAQHDETQMRAKLDAAIKADPADADVLIAMYRLPKADDDFRKKTKELIAQAAEGFRKDIEQDPDDATPCNQFAWLIGNTEGDYDEAIRLSQRSVELSRSNDDPIKRRHVPGYLDTLAHCYFYGKKDYTSAVRYQSEAHRLEPQSQAIKRQLDVFSKALEEQKRVSVEQKKPS
jgi:tetratricopeptide (TPR) repeat protein